LRRRCLSLSRWLPKPAEADEIDEANEPPEAAEPAKAPEPPEADEVDDDADGD
jgi:hypothetical protein